MCIIFHKPKGIILPKNILEMCWKSNPHGAGFMVSKDNELIVKKGFLTLDSFIESYTEYESENLVGHFRWATHGIINEDNCHPFNINDNVAFVHNGVIHGIHKTGSDKPDTWHFNEEVLKPIVNDFPNIWNHKTLKYLLQAKIGSNNKLAFLSFDGTVSIYNEDKGSKAFGCWFSNIDYKTERNRPTNNYSKYTYNHNNAYDHSKKKEAPKEISGWQESKEDRVGQYFKKDIDYIRNSGKIFIQGVGGILIEQTNYTKSIKPFVSDNEFILCDNCNASVIKKDMIEINSIILCSECVKSCDENISDIEEFVLEAEVLV